MSLWNCVRWLRLAQWDETRAISLSRDDDRRRNPWRFI